MRTNDEKRADLFKLAKQRQADRLPPYLNLADVCDGIYECDYVSPWTISACNVGAEIMLIGQDWASLDTLEFESEEKRRQRRQFGQDQASRTNRRLREYLAILQTKFENTYSTNLFPFIKKGRKSAPIGSAELLLCAKRYAIPQIEIVSSPIVICLGMETFEAVCRAVGRPLKPARAQLPNPKFELGPTGIYGLPHPAQRGLTAAVTDRWKLLAQTVGRYTN